MDTDIFNSNNQGISSRIFLEKEAEPLLKGAAKWGKFLAILGFIGIGFIVLAAISTFFLGNNLYSLSKMQPNPMELSPFIGSSVNIFIGVFYLLIAILYFFPTNYLYKFSNRIKIALRDRDTKKLTKGFGSLKSCFKFIGIMTIVMIVLYIIIVIGAIFVFASIAAVNGGGFN